MAAAIGRTSYVSATTKERQKSNAPAAQPAPQTGRESAPSVLRCFSSADEGGIRQILHDRFRLAAGEGEHEFARAGVAIAARLGKRVFSRARDGEGLDETVIEHVRSPIACAPEVGRASCR